MRRFAATLTWATPTDSAEEPIVQSMEARSVLNASVAGRRWNGQLFQPTPNANAKAWGFGFVPPPAGLDSLAIPLGRHCFGQKVRIRIWRCKGLKATDPFRTPGKSGDELIFDTLFEAVASVRGEPIAQFCRVDLSGLGQWEPCLHLVEIGFAEAPRSPLAVGRSISGGPWTWECGWVHLKGREPVPLERPWGIAWAAYGREEAHRSCRLGEGEVETSGSADVDRFKLSLPSFTVLQTSQTVLTTPVEFQVPEPRSEDHSIPLPALKSRMLLPYRHADLLSAPAQAAVRLVHSEVHWEGGAEAGFRLDYRGWASRYDLVSIHRDTGELALTMGRERDLDPEEFPPQLPPQHIPLYSLYTTRDGVEAIPLLGWHDMVQDSRRADYFWWLENSRKALGQSFRKLRRGGTFRLAGYGDSLTSLGGRDLAMVDAPGGPARDTMGYFERYGDDWKSGVPLFSAAEGGERRHHRLGWNWHLKAAIESAYDVEVEYLNWGIPGTTTEATHKTIDGRLYPNGSEPGRLARLLASKPDLVTVCFGMNDIGEPTWTPMATCAGSAIPSQPRERTCSSSGCASRTPGSTAATIASGA